MGTIDRLLEDLSSVAATIAPFIVLTSCVVLVVRKLTIWAVVALIGSLLFTTGHLAHILMNGVEVTAGNDGGMVPTGKTIWLQWFLYIVPFNLGLLITGIGILGFGFRDLKSTSSP